MRRTIALVLLMFTAASNVEAVAGLVRDGAVHHEDAGTAAAHAQVTDGEHGHEDASAPAEHEHGEQHQHGTAGDHCTHGHGVAFVPAFDFPLFSANSVASRLDVLFHFERVTPTLTHPPRA